MVKYARKIRVVRKNNNDDSYTHLFSIFSEGQLYVVEEDIITFSSNIALKTYGERKMGIGEAFLVI